MNVWHLFKYQYFRILSNFTFGKLHKKFAAKKHKYKCLLQRKKTSLAYYRAKGIDIRNNSSFSQEIADIVSIQTLNKMKELELKQKIKEGKKVKVCFLIDNETKLSIIPIYEKMKNCELFEPFIVVCSDKDAIFRSSSNFKESLKKETLNLFETFKKQNYTVYLDYDENFEIIPMDNFKPDIVFLSAGYMDFGSSCPSNVFLNVNYLVCYMNYALNTINFYDYHYNNKSIAGSWKHFVETRDDYYELIKYSKYYGVNAVLTGYPKMDKYAEPIEKCVIPNKLNNGKPIIIYAPHWTISHSEECINLSTFHLYYKYFLNLLKDNPEINFVFKPHSNLMTAVVNRGVMTIEEYQKYIEDWNNAPNGMVITSGDYIDLFKKSELMITDCGSFIAEWLPTDKPCIYLVKPERNQATYMDGFSSMGKKILDKYYLCHNLEEIDRYFNMIMCDKQDPLREERIKLKDEVFINLGCAGQKIVDYLTEILTN